jgi:hypothetical protein
LARRRRIFASSGQSWSRARPAPASLAIEMSRRCTRQLPRPSGWRKESSTTSAFPFPAYGWRRLHMHCRATAWSSRARACRPEHQGDDNHRRTRSYWAEWSSKRGISVVVSAQSDGSWRRARATDPNLHCFAMCHVDAAAAGAGSSAPTSPWLIGVGAFYRAADESASGSGPTDASQAQLVR